MESATAAAAETDGPVAAWTDGGAQSITADSFRKLIARLKAGMAAPPSVSPVPEARELPALQAPVQDVPPARRPRDPGEEAGETAFRLLELMATATGLLPQERALAADTLLLLLPRMPERQVQRLAERVAIMDNPLPLLLAKLIRDPRPGIAAPVLERSAQLCDRDMIAAAALQDAERLRMIARRRVLSPVLSGHLVASGDPEVILALLRNAGAQLPQQAFARLSALAAEHPVLLAPLATRADLPAAAAFQLYWSLPPELRRLMLTRFLTDSGTLGRILRIALAEDGSLPGGALRQERPVPGAALDAALDAAAALRVEEAALLFGEIAGIAEGTARRILADRQGEPMVVLFKALGISRGRFIEAMEGLRAGGGLLDNREPGELQAVFDGLSFTKARVLITYWDWFTRKTGPYAPES